MNTFKLSRNRFTISIIFVLVVGAFLTANWWNWKVWQQNKLENRYFAVDYSMGDTVAIAIWDIYKKSGRIINSLQDLESTSYYPFTESFKSTCHNGEIHIVVSGGKEGFLGYVEVSGIKGGRNHRRSLKFDSFEPAVRSRIMMLLYTSGVEKNINLVEDVKGKFVKNYDYALSKSQCQAAFRKKSSIPRPLSGDFPVNNVELRKYVQWLCALQGVNTLKDAWGRPLVFSMNKRKLICHSQGEDGVANTKDDIFVISQ